ncbi:MAG: hypothetical protein MUF86_11400 [Akkermansiaceae bacterium]|jgi:hypothetical protein|nr:hypothetical protein [Akkermansiaceae bacterium]MCU0778258.1 hypothetical protein [Akkermansiaceae bacterium]
MANDADIKIGLQTVGADAAAREIEKVPDAIDQVPPALNAWDGPIRDQIEHLRKMSDRAKQMGAEYKELATETKAAADAEAERAKAAEKSGDTKAALESLGRMRARVALVAASFAALAATSQAVFGEIAADMQEATDAGSRWEDQNTKLAAGIQALGDPAGTVKAGWKAMGESFLGWMDKMFFKSEITNKKVQEDAALTVRSQKSAYEQQAAAHAMMVQKILNAEIKLQEARDNLERSREERAGTSPGQSAANEVARIIQKQSTENKIIIDALAEARRAQAAALLDLKNLDLGPEAKDAARKIYEDAKKQISELSTELGYKLQSDALAVQNSVEEAQSEAKQGLQDKLKANAEELQKTLEAIIAEKGDGAQAGTRMALNAVEGLLADSKVTLDEAGRLNDAAVQFYQSADSNTTALRESTRKLIESDQKAVAQYQALNQQVATSVETQQAAIDQIRATISQSGATTVNAVQGLGTSIADQGNATVAALAAVQAGIGQITNRIAALQAQINQLFARSR